MCNDVHTMKMLINNYFGCLLLVLLASSRAFASETVEVDLFIENHKFTPEILELPEGRKIRITVHNKDATIEEFESIDLKREKIIFGNSKARVILPPLKEGEYKFFGEFHEDTAQGKIIVKKNRDQDV